MKRAPRLATGVILLLLSGSCGGQRVPVQPTGVVPAAQARLTVGLDREGNPTLRLQVRHLALPDRLRPPRRVYVVWTEKKTRQIANIGRLEVGADRRADFRSRTPHRVFRLLVTAEDRADGLRPRGPVVLQTGFFRVHR